MSQKWLIKLIAFDIPIKMFPLTENPGGNVGHP